MITVRDDYYGLCPIENIAPNVPNIKFNYFKDLIHWATSLGYVPGDTLFGFPYDWRQSIQHKPTHDKLIHLIDIMAQKTPHNKIDVITHSSGGLLLKYLLGDNDHIKNKIRNWIPIATPWIGSGALLYKSLISGYDLGMPFISGIGGLSERTAHQLEMGWPSIFELLPDLTAHDQWKELPSIMYRVRGNTEKINTEHSLFNFLKQINENNEFIRKKDNSSYPQPFDVNIWQFTRETRVKLKNIEKLGDKINIYNIAGNNIKTKHSIVFTDNINDLNDIKNSSYNYEESNGDGFVPIASSISHGMKANDYYYNGKANHLQMLESNVILHSIRHFLGLSCDLEGEWTFSTQNDPSLPSQFKIKFKHNKKVKPIESELNRVHDIIDLEYRGLKGNSTLDQNCLTMTGIMGNGRITGRRTIGTECLSHEKKEILTHNGRYIYRCVYGFWSSKATLKCENGFIKKDGVCIHEDKDRTSVIALAVIVAIICINILILLGYMKLRNMRRTFFRVL